jgi:triacylglycerol lipase
MDALRGGRRVLASVLASSALLAGGLLLAAGAARAHSNPIGLIYHSLGISPPGANNFACKPSAQHPSPVVLVHGTLFDQTVTWNLLAPILEHAGYCVFALDYGHRGTQEVAQSAGELAAFIQRVLAATGAKRVSIVGHSQGGMMPRYYLEFMGGKPFVDKLVALAPSNHGTTLFLAPIVGQYGDCPACTEQVVGSSFLAQLNGVDQTPPPVFYTVIESKNDEIVTPYTSAFLPAEDGRVTNVLLQDKCPADISEHIAIPYDPVAIQWVLNALGRNGPADPFFMPDCLGISSLLGEL